MPLSFDLIAEATARANDGIDWHNAKELGPALDLLPAESEYVALWSRGDRRPIIGEVTKPVSQWIRRLIADKLGIGAEWDYRSHPHRDRAQETLALLRPLRMAEW